ncbi:hypothetical protein [Brevibacillus halotolerans]|uniref:hypothetical protein n=1 Tax=Brevibacillus halotolerans TaxID=1507437 RepID=UPI0015EEEF18|nr:hypothetical protein [Brevibacillus halotolerans]MBA4535201.1 hypothetical protein [Brevibacillus halotolerans]
MPLYNVEFNDDFIEATPYCHIKVSQHGTVLDEYQMSFDDFIEAIMDSRMKTLKAHKVLGVKKRKRFHRIIGKRKLSNPYLKIETPYLPTNCIKHFWINRSQKEQLVFIEIPKQKWDISFYNSKFKQVGFPRLIFGYRLKENLIKKIYILAIKDKGRVLGKTEIFKFPFANVLNGSVCMGGNSLPTIKDLTQLSTMHNLFFAAPSSSCYYDTERNYSGISDLRELYTYLQDKIFPEEWLKSKDMTLEEYCKRV